MSPAEKERERKLLDGELSLEDFEQLDECTRAPHYYLDGKEVSEARWRAEMEWQARRRTARKELDGEERELSSLRGNGS
jgi:hypothetical protein